MGKCRLEKCVGQVWASFGIQSNEKCLCLKNTKSGAAMCAGNGIDAFLAFIDLQSQCVLVVAEAVGQ